MKAKWFTSDLHLLQKNIIKNKSPWTHADPKSLRDFKDEYHMSEEIINNINKYVGKEDELYILGDVIFSKDIVDLQNYIRKIVCDNIYLILGNHDHLITHNIDRSKRLFSTINYYEEIRMKFPVEGTDPNRDPWTGRQHIILSHYAMRVWNGSHRGSWMLYGHSHVALDGIKHSEKKSEEVNQFYQQTKTMDVGVDNAFRLFGEYRPFSFNEINNIMEKRNILYIDHHEKKTL